MLGGVLGAAGDLDRLVGREVPLEEDDPAVVGRQDEATVEGHVGADEETLDVVGLVPASLLDDRAKERLSSLLADNQALKTVHEFREKLSEIWSGANVSNEKLLQQLRDWCREAEASGIEVLEDFAARIRAYQLSPASV